MDEDQDLDKFRFGILSLLLRPFLTRLLLAYPSDVQVLSKIGLNLK